MALMAIVSIGKLGTVAHISESYDFGARQLIIEK